LINKQKMNNIEHKIEFDEIRTLLRGHCISHLGTERVDELTFLTDANDIRFRLALVSEVGQLIDTELQLPGEDFFDLRLPVRRIRVEGVNLEEQEMWELKRSLDTLHSWLAVIQTDQSPYPNPLPLSNGVFTFHSVTRRIEEILDKYGHVRDTASPELQRIRRELHRTEGSVSRTLNSILESAKREGLIEQTTMPTIRDGRLVIPVAPALKRRIRGIVHGESASGKTIFVEPSAVVEANNTLRELEADERREIKRILQAFTEELRPNIPELLRAYEFLADLELALAKHRLAQQMGAVVPEVHNRPLIDWTLAAIPCSTFACVARAARPSPSTLLSTPRPASSSSAVPMQEARASASRPSDSCSTCSSVDFPFPWANAPRWASSVRFSSTSATSKVSPTTSPPTPPTCST